MTNRCGLIVLLALLSAPGTVWGQQDIQATLQKLVGTWVQDFSKTRPAPSPVPRSRTHQWELAGKDKMRHVSETINANGEKVTTETQTDDYSGKEYPDGDPGQVSTFRVIDANTIQQIRSRNGQIVRFLERVISPDGKTLTIRQIAVDAQGKGSQAIQVYYKK